MIEPQRQQLRVEITGRVLQQVLEQDQRYDDGIGLLLDQGQVVQDVGGHYRVRIRRSQIRRQEIFAVRLVAVLVVEREGRYQGLQVVGGEVQVAPAQPGQLEGADVTLHLLILWKETRS